LEYGIGDIGRASKMAGTGWFDYHVSGFPGREGMTARTVENLDFL
jgi:hypothetical protein